MSVPESKSPFTGSQDFLEDPRLLQAVHRYRLAMQSGEMPDRRELIREFPELQEELAACLEALEFVERFAPQVHDGGDAIRPLATFGDFRVIDEIGRGGMGVVYRAEQLSLGRTVALKVLPFATMLDSRQLARFKNEARAAASLHHTNIVPVFSVGCERGVHYYAMQHIQGQTVAELIRDLRRFERIGGDEVAAPEVGPNGLKPAVATETTLDARSTGQSSKSLAYVRAVASIGAKVAEALDHAHAQGVIHRDIKPSNLILDAAGKPWISDFGLVRIEASPELTMTGDLIGTLRYMSPEQVLARRAVVDHRSDIYALGATIYEMLALQPAFSGEDRQELLRQIAMDDPRPPRRCGGSIPADLATIVLTAMAKNPAERYATGQDLADDLRRFLDDKPITAKKPSFVRRAAKWYQRHKPLVWSAAVCVLMAVLVGAGSIGWTVRDHKVRVNRLESKAFMVLQESRQWQDQGKWQAALEAAKRAELLVAGSDADLGLRRRVRKRVADLEFVFKLEETQLERYSWNPGDPLSDGALCKNYAAAFREYGVDVEQLDASEAADRILARSVQQQIAFALDDWALQLRHAGDLAACEHLLAVASAVDDNQRRKQLRRHLTRKDIRQEDLINWAEQDTDLLPPATLLHLCATLARLGCDEQAENLLRQAQQKHPAEFLISFFLAQYVEDGDEKVRFASVALAARPNSLSAHVSLGHALRQVDRREEALAQYRTTAQLFPQSALAHSILGGYLRDCGQKNEALAECLKAVKLDPQSAPARNNLGSAWKAAGELDKAIDEYKAAIKLDPQDSIAHHNLGNALMKKGQLTQAITMFHEAIRLDAKYAKAHHNLGNALRGIGEYDKAIEAYRAALQLEPENSDIHTNFGIALKRSGEQEAAISHHRKAIELDSNHVHAHINLGADLHASGRVKEAVSILRRALELDPESAVARSNLGIALLDDGQPEQAIREQRQAIARDPRYAVAHHQLGVALTSCGRPQEAIAPLKRAVALEPGSAAAYNDLGVALKDAGRLQDSIEAHKRAIELDEEDALFHYNLANAWQEFGKLENAMDEYRRAIELDPHDADAHVNLAGVLYELEKPQEAIDEYKKAIQLNPQHAIAHLALGIVLEGSGRLEEAVGEYHEFCDLNPRDADIHIRLGGVLAALGRHDEAIDEYRHALGLNRRHAAAHIALGIALARSGALEESINEYQAGIDLGFHHPVAYNGFAWLLATCPNPQLRDAEKAVEMATRALKLAPDQGSIHNTLGVAHYRAGNWQLALESLQKSMDLQKGGDASDWLFTAMAHRQLEHRAEARQWFDKAVAWLEQHKSDNEELRRFRTEAQKLLGAE